MIGGFTFNGWEHMATGRVCATLRGHAFRAASTQEASSVGPGSRLGGSVLWTDPDAAVLYRRQLTLPQPRRLRVTWLHVDLRAAVALTDDQARAWNIDQSMRLDDRALIERAHTLAGDAGLDAVVLGARRVEPVNLEKLGLAPEHLSMLDPTTIELPESPRGSIPLLVCPGTSPERLRMLKEWECTGDRARFDEHELCRYPAMLREKRTANAGMSGDRFPPEPADTNDDPGETSASFELTASTRQLGRPKA